MSPLDMGKLRSGLVFSTGGLAAGKRMTRLHLQCVQSTRKRGALVERDSRGEPQSPNPSDARGTREGRCLGKGCGDASSEDPKRRRDGFTLIEEGL